MAITTLIAVMLVAPTLALTPDIAFPGAGATPSWARAEHALPWPGDEEFLDIPWDNALPHANRSVRILHITDTHFSNKSHASPWSDRLHNFGAHVKNHLSQKSTTPAAEFTSTLERAKSENVDLVAITGDLINFPSKESVDWTLEQLKAMKAPFIFTAGIHDWHLERKFDWEERYDSQRMPNEYGVLRDLYLSSGKGVADKSFTDPRFGYAGLSSGLLVVSIDNSNYHVDSQQLAFFSNMVRRGHPLLLLLHIPLYLPGLPSWGADMVMGHPAWGRESDANWAEEGRLQWPPSDASVKNSSTFEFIEAVKRAARDKVLVAVVTGHTHQNAVVPIPCPHDAKKGCQTSAKQYTTRSNSEGWSRMFQLRFVPVSLPPTSRQKSQPPLADWQEAPATPPFKQVTPQGSSSSLWSSWAVQVALLCFFGIAVLTVLSGFSQRFLIELMSGKRGSWAYCDPFSSETFQIGGTMASKLGLVSEMPGVSEVSRYGTLDAGYGDTEVLL